VWISYFFILYNISNMEIFIAALVLLVIASMANLLAKRFKIPYTILLFVIGIWLIPVVQTSTFAFLGEFSLTPDLLFYVFLPILIFESWYNIKYHQLAKNSAVIWSLATVWLIISASVVWFWLYFVLWLFGIDIPLLITLLFGIIISATDPVAVLSIFKDFGVPQKLSLIFEWESLFNDGTAVAIFLIIIEIVRHNEFTQWTILQWIIQFLVMIFGGILLWSIFGFVFSKWVQYIKNNEAVEVTLTMLLAHFTFIFAEQISHHLYIGAFNIQISGVIATAYAAIVMWNYGKSKISPKVEDYMEKFRNFFAFICNSLVFLLMGMMIGTINIPFSQIWLPISFAIFFVVLGRIVSIYIPIGLVNLAQKKRDKISKSWQHLMAWWSLRWVVWLTLAIMIPTKLTLTGRSMTYSIRDFVLVLVISTIVFSLLVKWLSIKYLIKKLWIDKLHQLEIFEKIETDIIVYNEIIKKIDRMKKDHHTSKSNYDILIEKYKSKLAEVRLKMQIFLWKRDTNQLVLKALQLHGLWVEKDALKNMFRYNEIDEVLYSYWLQKLERQIRRIERGEVQFRSKKMITNKKRYRNFLNTFVTTYNQEKHSNHDKYILLRSRFLITWKVINNLRKLKNIDFGYDKNLICPIIQLYENFHQNAKQEIENISKSNFDLVNEINHKLLNKWLMKKEESLIKDLFHKDMITEKLYRKFMWEIELKILERY